MATTTYTILKQNVEGEFLPVDSKSKKSTALAAGQAIRDNEKVSVRVVTSGGATVLELKARKPQRKTRPYTRDVADELVVWQTKGELPEDFQIPEGKRVAYTRRQKGCAILHDFEEQYWVVSLANANEILGTFSTTRQCGRFLADHVAVDENKNVVLVGV